MEELADGPPFVTPWSFTTVDRIRGLLFGELGREQEAERFFARAYRRCSENRSGPCLAWTCYDYGSHLIDRSPERAEDLISQGQKLVARLGMVTLQKRLASLSRRLSHSSLAGLTRRESEIVHLVAEGKTNREIADRLFISYHTVVSHMRRIFEKTGAKNRIDLARRTGARTSQPQRLS